MWQTFFDYYHHRKMKPNFFIESNEFTRGALKIFKTFACSPYESSVLFLTGKSLFLDVLWKCDFWNLVLILVLEVVNLIKLSKENFDIIFAITVIVYLGAPMMSLWKLLTILYNRGSVKRIVDTLENMFPKVLQEQIEMDLARYRRKFLLTMKLFWNFFLVLVWIFNVGAVASCFFEHFVLGEEFSYTLPYETWYPFEINSVLRYIPAVVSHWAAGYLTVSSLVASDWLLCSIIIQLCMHFDNITRKLRELNPVGSPEDHSQLQKIIEYHIVVLNLCDYISDMFNFSILFNCLCGSLMLCAGAFLIVSGVDAVALVKFLIFVAGQQFQVFLICYYGNRLKDASENVSFGAYEENWINADIPYKKSILIIIQRSNKPCILTAVGFDTVSVETYGKVLSLAYKVFAVLRTLY